MQAQNDLTELYSGSWEDNITYNSIDYCIQSETNTKRVNLVNDANGFTFD